MRFKIVFAVIGVFGLLLTGQTTQAQNSPEFSAIYKPGPVAGKMIDAGFLYGETNYHAVQQASDGCVYYAINSHFHGQSATLFRYDPRTGAVKTLGSMNPAVGEDGTKVFNQDKIHCDLYEMNGKLWFSTQGGSYGGGNYGPYPGGHFLNYDLKTGKIGDLGIAAPGEGIVCMGMDAVRGRMFGITWPGMLFVYYDIPTGKIKNFGKQVATPGVTDLTSLPGNRAIAVDPETGDVYWHNMDETISRYSRASDSIEILASPTLNIPILKLPSSSGFDKVLWRAIRWSPSMKRFYGVDTNGEYLFSLEPKSGTIEILDRIAAAPNRRSGNRGSASLAFELSPDGKRICYIASVRGEIPGKSGLQPTLHLVTYDIGARHYTDHGSIVLGDGRVPVSCSGLDVGSDGNLYLVCIIPLGNAESDREKKIIEAHFRDMPKEKVKNGAYEVNLVVVKEPGKKSEP